MRRLGLVCGLLVLCAPLGAQDKPMSHKTLEASKLPSQITGALKTGTFVLNISKNEYYLKTEEGIDLMAGSAGPRVRVDLQIGKYMGKPAYVSIDVAEKNADATSVLKEFQFLADLKTKDPMLTLCHGKRVCVKTCTNSVGHEFCCKWKCLQ